MTLSLSPAFEKITIIFILVGIMLHFFVEAHFAYTGFRNICLVLALLSYSFKLILSKKIIIQSGFLFYALLSIPIAFLSIGFWFSLSEINVYITLILTIIVITSDYEFFKKCVIYLVYILLAIVVYEFITKSYVFIVYRNTQWGYKALDPHFYGGYSQVFRAKGLFEGPLGLAQFAIGVAFIFRNNLKIIIITIVFAILANGRLGVVITSAILVLYFIHKYNIFQFFVSKKGVKLLLGILVLLLLFGYNFINEKTIERFNKILSSEDTGNNARMYYWEKAVDVFSEYNLFHMIFGNSGYYRHIIGNSSENGWLMLLLNNGLLGFLYYSIPLMLIVYISISLKRIHYMYIVLLFICMFIQTFHLGALANLFYWIIIYSFYLEFKKLQNHEIVI